MAQKKYLHFDGVDDYARFADNVTWQGITTAVTMEVWCRTTDYSPSTTLPRYLLMKGTFAWGLRVGTWTETPPGILRAYFKIGGTARSVAYTNPARLWDGGWHQIVASFDGTWQRLYVDGEQVASDNAHAGVLSPSNTWGYIGAYNLNQDWYSGDIAIARVYNRALTAAEVVYNRRRPNRPVRRGLVANWDQEHINDPAGTWADSSGNGFDCAITGAVERDVGGLAPMYAMPALDGVDDRMHVAYNAAMAPAEYTAVARWRADAGCPDQSYIFARHSNLAAASWRMRYVVDNVARNFAALYDNGGAPHKLFMSAPIEPDTWYHTAIVKDDIAPNTQANLYVNGILDDTLTEVAWVPAPAVNVGLSVGDRWDNVRFFRGQVAEVYLYDRPLTQLEVRYLNRHPCRPLARGLVWGANQETLYGTGWNPYTMSQLATVGAMTGARYETGPKIMEVP